MPPKPKISGLSVKKILRERRERHQIEEDLKKNHALLSAVMNSSKDVNIFSLDRDCRYTAFNQAHKYDVKKWFGVDIAIGMSRLEVFADKDDCLIAKNIFDRVLKGESLVYVSEFRQDRPCTERHYSPIRDEKGAIIGITVFSLNITERRMAEMALQESEQRYHDLFNSITDAVFVSRFQQDGRPGQFIEVNDVACQKLGYTREELLQKNAYDLDLPETQLTADSDILQRLRARKDVTFEQTHLTKDGRRIPVELHVKPIVYLGEPAVIALARDITMRKNAALALERSEKKAKHLNDLLRAMYNIQHLIRNELDADKLLKGTCNALVETRGYLGVWIGVPDHLSGKVSSVAAAGAASRVFGEAPVTWDNTPNGRGPCGTAARERIPSVIDDVAEDPRFELWRKSALAAGCGSVASFPMLIQKRLWGVLTIKANRPKAFSEEEIRLLADLANEVGQALLSIEHQTEHKQAEATMRESEDKFSRIFHGAPVLMTLTDLETGRFNEVNEEMVWVSGFSREELIGKTSVEVGFISQEDRNRVLELLKVNPRINWLDINFQTKDGRNLQCSYFAEIVHINGRQHILSIIQDVTKLRKTENTLDVLYKAIESSMSAMALADLEGRVTYVNPACVRLWGFESKDEMIGKPAIDFWAYPENARKAIAEMLQGKMEISERVAKKKDGSFFQVHVSSHLVLNDTGEPQCLMVSAIDITERKKIEKALQESQKMEAIGLLAGGLAHDYNNILAANMLQLDFLLNKPDLKPEWRAALQMLMAGEERGAALTRQLLLFSRRQFMQPKPLELGRFVSNELTMLRRLLNENIEIVQRSHIQQAWVEADSGMMGQVIMNLCVNARDAMPTGGQIVISIKQTLLADSQVQDGVEATPGNYICLTLADTGCGMDSNTVKHIFEPFFTTKGVGKGTGLGLATVYGIIKQHNGWIEVSSVEGEGSEFGIYLPAIPAPIEASAEASSEAQPATGSETILLVEDDVFVQKSMAICLSSRGFHVHQAGDGAEALKKWGNQLDKIDLLITDMIMPGGVNGLDLGKAFQEKKPRLPVIVMSGYNKEMVEQGFPSQPGWHNVSKPCDANTLLGVVRKALDQAK